MPVSATPRPLPTAEPGADRLWAAFLARTRARRAGTSAPAMPPAADAQAFLELYNPVCNGAEAGRFAIAHLGESLDGRIATARGDSFFVTGDADLDHNHRLRALCDAVVVGAGTVQADDPQLTVRRVEGDSPVRVVIDTDRRLDGRYGVFRDGAAPTLLLCGADVADAQIHGEAQVIGVPRAADGAGLEPGAVLDILAARGLTAVFLEGGGVTVSRFLAAGVLNRLQITIAPLIIGSGRPGIALPEIARLSESLRPPARRFTLGEDVLFDLDLDAG